MSKAIEELRPCEFEADVVIRNEGSLILFHLLTPEAHEFVDRNVSEDAQYFGNALAVEPRYAECLANGMIEAGLELQ
jgi:hypothetical protein